MLQKVTRLDSVPTAEETVLTTEVPTKESRLYTLLHKRVSDQILAHHCEVKCTSITCLVMYRINYCLNQIF